LLTTRLAPRLKTMDKMAVLWFCLSKNMSWNCVGSWTLTLRSWLHPSLLRGILFLQSHAHGRCPRSFWAAVERVRLVRLKILDLGSLCLVHGDHHSGKKPDPCRCPFETHDNRLSGGRCLS
jgi:hypothetical protein